VTGHFENYHVINDSEYNFHNIFTLLKTSVFGLAFGETTSS